MEEIYKIIIPILSVSMLISFGAFLCVLRNYLILKKREEELQELNAKLKKDSERKNTQYSEDILKYVRMFTTQVTFLHFRDFIDNHKVEMTTKENIRTLVADISNEVHDSINADRIIFDDTLFTKEFYESYIIRITMDTIKDLLSKTVDEI